MIVRELLTRFGFDVDSAGLDAVDRKVDRSKSGLAGLGAAAGPAAAAIAAIGAGAAVRELNASVDASLAFGKAMGKVQSLIPGNVDRAAQYRGELQRLSVQLGRTSEDVSAGLYDVLSTFGDTTDTVKLLEIAVKAGAAGAATTKDGIALIGAVTKAYGDTSAEAAQKVSDLGFQTVNLGKVELPELAASMGRVTPLASTLGVKLEELFAVMASATGVTGSGAEVSTQFASVLRAMIDRSPEMAKAFSSLIKKGTFGKGVKTMQQAIGAKGLQGTLNALVGTTDGTAESIQKLFGRAEAMTLALHLTGKGAADFNDKQKAMKQVAGATQQAFDAQTTGFAAQGHAIDKAKAKWEAMRQDLGDKLTPALVELYGAGMRVAYLFGEVIAPIFANTQVLSIGLGDDLNGVRVAFDAILRQARLLRAVVLGVVQAIDSVIFGLKEMILTAELAYHAARKIVPGSDEKDANRQIARIRGEIQTTGDDWLARTKARGAIIAGAPTTADLDRQRAETAAMRVQTAKDRAERSANAFRSFVAGASAWGAQSAGGAGMVANVGGLIINVSVPAGTEASAAARIGDTGARALVDSLLDQASRAFPLQTAGAK